MEFYRPVGAGKFSVPDDRVRSNLKAGRGHETGAARRWRLIDPGLAIALPQIDGRQSWHRRSDKRG